MTVNLALWTYAVAVFDFAGLFGERVRDAHGFWRLLRPCAGLPLSLAMATCMPARVYLSFSVHFWTGQVGFAGKHQFVHCLLPHNALQPNAAR